MNVNSGKLMIAAGVLLVLAGLCVIYFKDRISSWRLPGDIHIQRENFSFHFPLVTCLVISVILTLLIRLIQWLSR